MKIVHFQRRPSGVRFSIEGYFERVRESLAPTIPVELRLMPCVSQGLWRRVHNLLDAALHQGDINHVTGDVNYVAILLRRKRTVLTVLDCEILHRLTGLRRQIVKLFWYSLPASRVSYITVISEETKRQLLKEIRFSAKRIRVIPVSVSYLFQPHPKAFQKQCPRILQVGTKANKNLLRLAEALRGISCEVDVVGPMTAEQVAAFQSNEISHRVHTGLSQEEIVELYRLSDIVSFVSTHEGFGMPIVEAQWTERVCVTSNCSSMPEVAGDGACLVDPFEIASIRSGFLKVISDSAYRERLIENGRTNRLRFDSQRIANQFADLYAEMLRD